MMPDENDMKCRRGWATNHFVVDTSKPGGKAFVAAVEGVATPEDVNTKTVEELAIEEAAKELADVWDDAYYGPDGDPYPVSWGESIPGYRSAWVAAARKAKELFRK